MCQPLSIIADYSNWWKCRKSKSAFRRKTADSMPASTAKMKDWSHSFDLTRPMKEDSTALVRRLGLAELPSQPSRLHKKPARSKVLKSWLTLASGHKEQRESNNSLLRARFSLV